MKKYTLKDMKKFRKTLDGRLMCPSGDYRSIPVFKKSCIFYGECLFRTGAKFIEMCSFKGIENTFRNRTIFTSYCTFNNNTTFGNDCYFGSYITFGSHCHFGYKCIFGNNSVFKGKCFFENSCEFGNHNFFHKGSIFEKKCSFQTNNTFSDNLKFGIKCTFQSSNQFGSMNTFGDRCEFQNLNKFGPENTFSLNTKFGITCSFSSLNIFGSGCSFYEFPVHILNANLGDLSTRLTNELMHRDADSHPIPKLFEKWAKEEGDCPYTDYYILRLHQFNENRNHWKSGIWKPMKTSNLIKAICKEKGWTYQSENNEKDEDRN